MDFEEKLYAAKQGDWAAKEFLLEQYRTFLIRNAIVNGRFDEDLYQELCITFLKCVLMFRIP
ncbi:MAG: helix-turn-helix domain-containing protein [Muribaculaceae bacterium]|nr:helix-turn-helix domain-containing protein [Muribaculaceae bacterium]